MRAAHVLLLASAAAALQPSPLHCRPCGCRCCSPLAARNLVLQQSDEDPEGLSGAAVSALRWYKREISPLFPPGCRYIPTCSEYAIQSFKQFSVPQAAVLTAWRLVRCNPLHLEGLGCGVDEPCWPPPAYWAGSGRVRNTLDDDASRRKALGLDDGPMAEGFSFDGSPFAMPRREEDEDVDGGGSSAS